MAKTAKNDELNRDDAILYLAYSDGNGAMRSWIKLSLKDAAWAPLSVFLLSLILGNVFHAYLLVPGIDKSVHVGGGMAITYFFATSISHSQRLVGTIRHERQLVFALLLSALVALAWEGVELLGDIMLNLKMNHGLTDSLLDVLFGLLGSLIFLFFRADGKASAEA